MPNYAGMGPGLNVHQKPMNVLPPQMDPNARRAWASANPQAFADVLNHVPGAYTPWQGAGAANSGPSLYGPNPNQDFGANPSNLYSAGSVNSFLGSKQGGGTGGKFTPPTYGFPGGGAGANPTTADVFGPNAASYFNGGTYAGGPGASLAAITKPTGNIFGTTGNSADKPDTVGPNDPSATATGTPNPYAPNIAGGAGAFSGTPAATTTTDPNAFNPGESPTAYMTRIGMSAADQQSALAIAQQNPGMTFQQIVAQMHGGGNGSTGNNVNGTTLGALTNPGLGSVNGVPGYTGGGTFSESAWHDPGYDFRLAEGNKLVQGSAAAQGNYLSGPTLKAISDYGQNSASQEYDNAYNRFAGNRAFNYGVDTGDRNFNYQTQLGDQNYNLQLAQALTGQGQFGAAGQANTNQIIAALISQNLLTGGQANAAGTIGGSNAITGGISGALGNLTSQQIINLILGARGQG